MKVLFSGDKLISQAYEQFEYCTQDQSMRHMAQAREKFQWDMANSLYCAEQEGLEKGMEAARLEDARKLKSLGVSREIIIKATGLSSEAVEKL